MTEIDVTLTDYALALLCTWFSLHLKRSKLWMLFFASVGLAALAGGSVHGFFLDESTLGYRILWPATLLAVGLTAVSAWMITGELVFGRKARRYFGGFAALWFLAYAGIVLVVSQSFKVVIMNYGPGMLALLVVSLWKYWSTRHPAFRALASGLIISFVAAFVQQAQIGIHPLYFNHNSTYHLIQAVGLLGIYRGARAMERMGKLS